MNALRRTIAIVAATLLCACVLAGCGQGGTGVAAGGASMEQRPTITVNATSEVKAVPDKAQVGVAVVTQAATAEEAQSTNAADVDAVIAALLDLGIAEKSIQTTETYLSPRYDYSMAAFGEDTSKIVGYEMTTRLSVGDLEIDQLGKVLQAAVAAGATNSDGIRYYSSDYDALYQQALKEAVAAARVKAQALAEAAEVSLGGVFHIEEGYQNTAYRYESTDSLAMGAAADNGAMKVMPGEVDITAQVTVTYAIG